MFLDIFNAATHNTESQRGVRVEESADQMLHVGGQPTREGEATLCMKEGERLHNCPSMDCAYFDKLVVCARASNASVRRCVPNQTVYNSGNTVEVTQIKSTQKQLDCL